MRVTEAFDFSVPTRGPHPGLKPGLIYWVQDTSPEPNIPQIFQAENFLGVDPSCDDLRVPTAARFSQISHLNF